MRQLACAGAAPGTALLGTALLGTALLGAAAARAAPVQTSPLPDTSPPLTAGTFTVATASRQCTLPGVSSACNNGDGSGKPADIVPPPSRGSLAFTREDYEGAPFASLVAADTSADEDMTFNMTVTKAGGAPITGLSTALAAPDTSRYGSIGATSGSSALPPDPVSSGVSSPAATGSIAATGSFDANVDLNVTSAGAPAGTTLPLDRASGVFVPEPATCALLLGGCASLLALRALPRRRGPRSWRAPGAPWPVRHRPP